MDEHLEAVVEANTRMDWEWCQYTVLSGLGFENSGVSGAHALGVGVTALPGMEKKYLHGEMVALGVMTELVMEKRTEECKELAGFFTKWDCLSAGSRLELMFTARNKWKRC